MAGYHGPVANPIRDASRGGLPDCLAAGVAKGLQPLAEQVRQAMRDQGVTYNVANGGMAAERPWLLDPLPVVFSATEFAALAAGLAQRARILQAILDDLYGKQRLLREAYIPARLVLGNPAFLRPCHGLAPARPLVLYGSELVRTPTGGFCVLRDRTQAPTGAGYALQNRLVIARVLEESFGQANVHRLAGFFRTLRDALADLSPVARDNPHIAVLSAGALSPTYFEQAFLAQYLGYPLVEGGDLAIRDQRVFLKTLGGLSPVNVVLRQPDDDFCDPLELRSESQLGVPGLVESVRANQVAVANPLGAGLVQSPLFLPFLPRIARDYFGEALALESAPSYWCGDPVSMAHVEANLDRMVLRSAWANAGASLVAGRNVQGQARQQLLGQLRAHPEQFVAQEWVPSATVATVADADVVPRPFLLKCYAVRADGDYQVMPGGLAFAAATDTDTVLAASTGALAKDVWVRSETPVEHFSLLPPPTLTVQLSRGGSDLPSRSADNLFWLGRYAERVEAVARLGRQLLARIADEAGTAHASRPAPPVLFDILAKATEHPAFDPSQQQPGAWIPQALCCSSEGSLPCSLRALVRSAMAVRDRLSGDTFRVLGGLGEAADRAEGLAETQSPGALAGFLDGVIKELSALSGLAMESMTRGHGWRFLDMGRRLERALQLLSLLHAAFASGAEREGALLETLLAIADSSITYRRRYMAGLHPAAVVDLLLADDSNPRAVVFQLLALNDHLRQIPHETQQGRLHPEQRLALGALTRVQLLDIYPACQGGERASDGPPLLGFLKETQRDLLLLSEQLCTGYLSHAVVARPLAQERQGNLSRRMPS